MTILLKMGSWAPQRCALIARIGTDLTLPSIVSRILEREEAWTAFAGFCEEVMAAKEAAEREREENPLAGALRAGRGRRRLLRRRPPPGGSQPAGSGGPRPAIMAPPPPGRDGTIPRPSPPPLPATGGR